MTRAEKWGALLLIIGLIIFVGGFKFHSGLVLLGFICEVIGFVLLLKPQKGSTS
jgi:membrane-bound ClpP family serine protease